MVITFALTFTNWFAMFLILFLLSILSGTKTIYQFPTENLYKHAEMWNQMCDERKIPHKKSIEFFYGTIRLIQLVLYMMTLIKFDLFLMPFEIYYLFLSVLIIESISYIFIIMILLTKICKLICPHKIENNKVTQGSLI